MMVFIGWVGAVLFAFCGLPQAIKTYRTKQAKDFSILFLIMWLGGEVFTFSYVFHDNTVKSNWQLPLLFNYLLNTIIVVYLLYAKFLYGRTTDEG